MPASEIVGWMNYFHLFPFEGEWADWRMAQLAELTNNIAKGNIRKYGSWKFFVLDPLNKYDLKGAIEQAEVNAELAYAEALEAQERAENGNQTTES